jgi:hypothetical protein
MKAMTTHQTSASPSQTWEGPSPTKSHSSPKPLHPAKPEQRSQPLLLPNRNRRRSIMPSHVHPLPARSSSSRHTLLESVKIPSRPLSRSMLSLRKRSAKPVLHKTTRFSPASWPDGTLRLTQTWRLRQRLESRLRTVDSCSIARRRLRRTQSSRGA